MQIYTMVCALYSIAAVVTVWYSAQMLGIGVWAQVILVAALVVATSPAYAPLRPLARGIGAATAVLSGLAVALGLLAGTIGGSFNVSTESGILLACFGSLFIFGMLLSRTTN